MKIKKIVIILILELTLIYAQKYTNSFSLKNDYSLSLKNDYSLTELNPNESKTDMIEDDVPLFVEYDETLYLEETINPDTYIVGPGDEFAFNMVGTDGIINLPLIVSPLGDVLIPAVGVVKIDKLNLSEAFNKIKENCLLMYPHAKINLTLVNIRKFKVKIIGILDTPGFVNVSPISHVSDVFQKFDLTKIMSFNKIDYYNAHHRYPHHHHYGDSTAAIEISSRNIKLIRDNKEMRVDLVKYNMFGDDKNNPFLQQGDIIKIGFKEKAVSLYGGIKLPGIYELVMGETLYDIIKVSGGFTKNADSTKIDITRFVNDSDKVDIVISNIDEAKQTILKDEDFIRVRYKKDYKRWDEVRVTGEVKYPGKYVIIEGETTITNLLTKAGGFTTKSDLSKINVNNQGIEGINDIEYNRITLMPSEDRSEKEKEFLKARARVNKGSISSSEYNFTQFIKEFKISRGDNIHIPSLYSFVEVLGAVNHPGRFPFESEGGYYDYIDMAGGKTKNASNNKYIIKSSTGQRLQYSKNIAIENGDIIFIPEKMEFNTWILYRDIITTVAQTATLLLLIQSVMN